MKLTDYLHEIGLYVNKLDITDYLIKNSDKARITRDNEMIHFELDAEEIHAILKFKFMSYFSTHNNNDLGLIVEFHSEEFFHDFYKYSKSDKERNKAEIEIDYRKLEDHIRDIFSTIAYAENMSHINFMVNSLEQMFNKFRK